MYSLHETVFDHIISDSSLHVQSNISDFKMRLISFDYEINLTEIHLKKIAYLTLSESDF